MGIAGHILGPKKLRKLAAMTGIPLDRAYIRNGDAEGVTFLDDGGCAHYQIDPKTGASEKIDNPGHWTSCRDHMVRNGRDGSPAEPSV